MKIIRKEEIQSVFLLLFLGLFFFSEGKAATKDLKYVGMPVGGLFSGQVYLGGDGQLWNWDIFNISTTNPGGGGDKFYINPMQQQKKFDNGFSISVRQGMKEYNRTLNACGFSNVTFEGEYPIGKVRYSDDFLPVEVNLQAYSPFIPTDVENSGLPSVVMEYSVSNVSNKDVEVALKGWLQNMSCFASGFGLKGEHINEVTKRDNYTSVTMFSSKELQSSHPDAGTMSLTLLGKDISASPSCCEDLGTSTFYVNGNAAEASAPLGTKIVGGLEKSVHLKAGETQRFVFIISWSFPNIHLWNGAHNWVDKKNLRSYYSKQFHNSLEVADYIVSNPQLLELTKLWNKTWYDSSLKHDFLSRAFASVSTLATTASVRFHELGNKNGLDGRYYNYEGVYLGEGTCRHVSHYGQVLGRLFPSMARQQREQIDLGLSLTKEGVIGYRGEFSNFGKHDGRGYACDGQAGTILAIYREHLMSQDNSFLLRNWTKIKLAMQYMINQDKEKDGKADGVLEGAQYNTLDRIWYGKIPWISGLYAAALRASARMAHDVGDKSFEKECSRIADLSSVGISKLFNGEYFFQELDEKHLDAPNTNIGCHSDQLLGQYWSAQLGLGYIVPKEQIDKALRSIMKYNFVDSYEKYLQKAAIPVARFYADGAEQGLVVCSFPKGGDNKAAGIIKNDWEKLVVGYFSEIWTGQEHAVASVLLDEGRADDALKIENAVNRRYSPEKRNPYNEIEYGNHYTRAMSSYATFVSASGFYFDGPRGIIGFAPKINPETFRSAFVSSSAWGTYSQILGETEKYALDIKYGSLWLKDFRFVSQDNKIKNIKMLCNGKTIKCKLYSLGNKQYSVAFKNRNFTNGDKIIIFVQR